MVGSDLGREGLAAELLFVVPDLGVVAEREAERKRGPYRIRPAERDGQADGIGGGCPFPQAKTLDLAVAAYRGVLLPRWWRSRA